jgi:hypothetical protein
MDVQSVEVELEELRIPLPPRMAQTRAVLDRLSVVDVPLPRMLSTQHLADMIRGQATTNPEVDVAALAVALAREAREAADNAEAARALQRALEDAGRLHELACRAEVLVPTVRAAIEEVYARVRGLPRHTPATDFEAAHADEKARKAYLALEELGTRHSRLRRVHRLIIVDQVAGPAGQVLALFSDTRLMPPAWPSPIHPAEPAGPRERLARLQWLARPESQAWTPTAAEVGERYQEGLRALQAPREPATR